MHRLVVLAAALAIAPRGAAADCMSMELTTEVVTKPGATILGDGGVLVAATYKNRSSTLEKTPGLQSGWRVRADGGKLVAPKIVTLAPGLFVYQVAVTSQDKPVELEDEQHKVVASVLGSKAKIEQYAAPKLKKIEYRATSSRHSSQWITATLEAAPPPGTWAIVITDAKGVARSWGAVTAGGTTQSPYAHSDCASLPNGTNPPGPGELVSVFWVNTEGRRSEASKPIKLASGKVPKPNPY